MFSAEEINPDFGCAGTKPGLSFLRKLQEKSTDIVEKYIYCSGKCLPGF